MKRINYLFAFLLFIIGVQSAFGQASISIKDFKIMPGETKEIEFELTNTVTVRTFQLHLGLPEGLSVAAQPTLNTDRIGKGDDGLGNLVDAVKTLRYSPVNSYMTCQSADGIPFSGNEGTIFTLKVKAAEDFSLGYEKIVLDDVELVGADGITMYHPEVYESTFKVYQNFDITVPETTGGTVAGAGSYEWDTEASLTATAAEGYSFSKWSDETTANPYNFKVTEAKEISAVFTPNTYKVTYMIDGEEFQTADVTFGSKITTPEVPAREGYTFSGWADVPETMPARDITLSGNYVANKYNVIYMVDGEEYKRVEVAYGAEIPAEAAPEKEGHTFSGWSEAPAVMPAANVTVTGSFTVNTYKLTYVVDGEVYTTVDVEYGAAVEPVADPVKDGYVFSGWSGVPDTMPAHDVEVTGAFVVDGISGVTADTKVDVYSLSGLKILSDVPAGELKDRLGRGVYIVNDRTVVIR